MPNAASVTLINRLLAARLFDDAWTYYAATRPGSDRRQSRDPAFRSAVEARSAFDWTAANSIGVSTAILPDATNGLFDFTVSMGNGGTLLQQLQMLPPATMFSKGIVSGSNSLCAPGPIGLYAAKPVAKSGGWNYRIHLRLAAGSRTIRVPANCPVQMLALVARSSGDIDGVSGQINRILIRPVHAPARTAS
ncbi:hypothetical protein [Novosphingobium panipatense]|uniref:hypothetical protein n=1 Tax=Novosphingobium panipatense TaxID=428991 RepID=UPI00360DBE79